MRGNVFTAALVGLVAACASGGGDRGGADGTVSRDAAETAAGDAGETTAREEAERAPEDAAAARRELEDTRLSGDALPADGLAERPVTGASGPAGRVYPGFLPETFATEPLALLPPTSVTLPAELVQGPQGERLREEAARLVLDRLPEEIRILHTRAPVYGYREWGAGVGDGPRGGFLRSLLDWTGEPGAEGQIPALVGDSVEELGDSRGIRYFLFPRSLTVRSEGTFDYEATLDAYLLDARGERVVWAGRGRAGGTLPEGDPGSLLSGVVREAASRAVSDLASRLPGITSAGGQGGFTDAEQ